jgi:CarD family transcriptional regulator
LLELLSSDLIHQDDWIADENRRKQHYRELISGGDRVSLLRMVSNLYSYKNAQLAAGRKFHQSDDNFLRDAEKLLSSEISLVMDLSLEEARNYLRQQLNYV